MVFKLAYWPEIRRSVVLTLYAENDGTDAWQAGDPPLPWRYSYRVPPDSINIREVRNGDINGDSSLNGVPEEFVIAYEPLLGEEIIATNCQNAVALYMADAQDPAQWDVLITLSVAYMLAEKIVMALSGNAALASQIFQTAQFYAQQALVNQGNADDRLLTEPRSAILEARTGYLSTSNQRTFR